MSTLLLRFTAPLQSWGSDSKFDIRKTEREPTKSGVVGLLAAALGRKRDEAIDDLTALRFGVRVDHEGEQLQDFHMVHSEGKNATSYVTKRYYLSDAIFLVGLEGDDGTLTALVQALAHPVFPLFLGRRSCPPEGRVCLGLRRTDLLSALCAEPWQLPQWRQAKQKDPLLRILTDAKDAPNTSARQHDLPLSFHQENRQYGDRLIMEHAAIRASYVSSPLGNPTEHDPMNGLEGDTDVPISHCD
ncbi:MAG: type I-E CRISPR-associated protein Cas5/CasD [Clostridia bacterium]